MVKVATKTKGRINRQKQILAFEKAWGAGKSYKALAQRFGLINSKAKTEDEMYKPARAFASRLMTVGFTDPKTGKHRLLKPREGMKLVKGNKVGKGKHLPKPKAVAQKKPKIKVGGKGKTVTSTKNVQSHVVFITDDAANVVRLEIGNQVGLMKYSLFIEKVKPIVDKIENKLLTSVAESASVEAPPVAPSPEQVEDVNKVTQAELDSTKPAAEQAA
jgi:hypothetical protein